MDEPGGRPRRRRPRTPGAVECLQLLNTRIMESACCEFGEGSCRKVVDGGHFGHEKQIWMLSRHGLAGVSEERLARGPGVQ